MTPKEEFLDDMDDINLIKLFKEITIGGKLIMLLLLPLLCVVWLIWLIYSIAGYICNII